MYTYNFMFCILIVMGLLVNRITFVHRNATAQKLRAAENPSHPLIRAGLGVESPAAWQDHDSPVRPLLLLHTRRVWLLQPNQPAGGT